MDKTIKQHKTICTTVKFVRSEDPIYTVHTHNDVIASEISRYQSNTSYWHTSSKSVAWQDRSTTKFILCFTLCQVSWCYNVNFLMSYFHLGIASCDKRCALIKTHGSYMINQFDYWISFNALFSISQGVGGQPHAVACLEQLFHS